MLGILVPILITIHVYKQAKETGRNPILWSIINVAVVIGVQLLIGAILAVTWGVKAIEDNMLLVNLVGIVIALACSYFFVVIPVSRVRHEQSPPPPPQF